MIHEKCRNCRKPIVCFTRDPVDIDRVDLVWYHLVDDDTKELPDCSYPIPVPKGSFLPEDENEL